MNDYLPVELARRWGGLPYIKQRGQNEWSAACPQCGDAGHSGREWPDRFRMWIDPARGWCRHCGFQDFADSDKRDFSPSPEMRQKWLDERLAREQEEKRNAERAIELLRKEQNWLRWHGQIDATARAWWNSKGVYDYLIDAYKLGWCYGREFWSRDGAFRTDTATIPVFGKNWELRNVRHRLISPLDPNDKYRPDRTGLPATLYLTNPDRELGGQCLLVEGEIKSIVVNDRLGNDNYNVVGTPGKSLSKAIIDQLLSFDRIYICFDPDAKLEAWQLARRLPKLARVVTLPEKSDDFFTLFGGTSASFEAAIRQSRSL